MAFEFEHPPPPRDCILHDQERAIPDGMAAARVLGMAPAPRRNMTTIPRAPGFDQTLAFAGDPYRFITRTCATLGSEVFLARLFLSPTICLQGAEAADLFYRSAHLIRHGAAVRRIAKTLTGLHGVQGLDDAVHRHRKALFLAILTPARIHGLAKRVRDDWTRTTATWTAGKRVVFYDTAKQLLMRAVCDWAEVPLSEAELPTRTREVAALYEHAAAIGPRHWWARSARRRCERWMAGVLEDIRRGRLRPSADSAAHQVAFHRDLAGRELTLPVAAVELLNIVRPTVAVAVWLTQALHALHLHPGERSRLTTEVIRDTTATDGPLQWFVQEVRRWYPFFPAAMARVRDDFVWKGHHFPRHRRVVLDLYGTNHDPRSWSDPHDFSPARFRNRIDDGVSFIPQGGGDAASGHRCPGEPLAIALMQETVAHFTGMAGWRVPPQDLTLGFSRPPALPASRLVLAV